MADFVYEVDIPNRGTVRVNSPSELSDQQAYEMALKQPTFADLIPGLQQYGAATSAGTVTPRQMAPGELTAGQVVSGAITNLPSSLGNIAKGLYEAVTSPVQTVKGVLDISAGALQNLLPEKLVQFVGEDKASREVADKVGQFYADRYGSIEGAKRAFATDPAGVMADLSTFLTGGAMIAPRGAAALTTAARVVDPLQIAGKAVAATGKAVAPVIGMTTGVGTEAAKQALRAGYMGGDIGEMFKQNMRGNVPTEAVLDVARQNLLAMNADKQAAYRANMAAVKADKSVLDFTGIDDAVSKAENLVTFKGQVTNKAGAETLAKIQAEIANWKSLNPGEYHTPEGLDKLKQVIGGILEDITPNQKQSYAAAKSVYDSIKKEITNQAPEYAKAMREYSDASDLIREIERSLSLGQKASADTAMRKLQSLMRNNVQTNYGARINLGRQLEAAGGQEMMPALAGQAMSEWTPRGMQRATSIPGALLAYQTGGIAPAVGMAAVSSPRLMGEALYGAGAVGRGASMVGSRLPQANYQALTNATYQAGLLGANTALSDEMRRRREARAAGLFTQ